MTKKRAKPVAPTNSPVQTDMAIPARPRAKKPRRKLGRGLRFLLVGGIVAVITICLALGLVAFMPASPSDQRPYLIAALFTATPTASSTPTPTSTVTFTPIPTDTLIPSEVPTELPSVTIAPTETPRHSDLPLPTPDGVDRDAWVPILMYHYISVPPANADVYRKDLSVTPDNFRQQMQWLKDNGYETISLYQLMSALMVGRPLLPQRAVILTFDDGYEDNYQNVFPILKEMGFMGTFFVLTDVTDRAEPGYMTWDMLKEMYSEGMDIEVHGREHVEMSGRDHDWLVFHLLGASQTIQANLGYHPRFIAYPSGKYDDLTIQTAHEEGYWAAVTITNGAHHLNTDSFELQRVRIHGDWTLNTFTSVVSAYQP